MFDAWSISAARVLSGRWRDWPPYDPGAERCSKSDRPTRWKCTWYRCTPDQVTCVDDLPVNSRETAVLNVLGALIKINLLNRAIWIQCKLRVSLPKQFLLSLSLYFFFCLFFCHFVFTNLCIIFISILAISQSVRHHANNVLQLGSARFRYPFIVNGGSIFVLFQARWIAVLSHNPFRRVSCLPMVRRHNHPVEFPAKSAPSYRCSGYTSWDFFRFTERPGLQFDCSLTIIQAITQMESLKTRKVPRKQYCSFISDAVTTWVESSVLRSSHLIFLTFGTSNDTFLGVNSYPTLLVSIRLVIPSSRSSGSGSYNTRSCLNCFSILVNSLTSVIPLSPVSNIIGYLAATLTSLQREGLPLLLHMKPRIYLYVVQMCTYGEMLQ